MVQAKKELALDPFVQALSGPLFHLFESKPGFIICGPNDLSFAIQLLRVARQSEFDLKHFAGSHRNYAFQSNACLAYICGLGLELSRACVHEGR